MPLSRVRVDMDSAIIYLVLMNALQDFDRQLGGESASFSERPLVVEPCADALVLTRAILAAFQAPYLQ